MTFMNSGKLFCLQDPASIKEILKSVLFDHIGVKTIKVQGEFNSIYSIFFSAFIRNTD